MAGVHHATVKAALNEGFAVDATDDTITVRHNASGRDFTRLYDGDDPDQSATAEAKALIEDVKSCLERESDDYQNKVMPVTFTMDGEDWVVSRRKGGDEIARDPELEELFVSLANATEEELGEQEEEAETGSVVPAKYKQLYKERGDPNHCGDWLALTLGSLCRVTNEKGKEVTDIDRLETIANANDVKPERYGKLGLETNGWQGRFRMTVRNMLTKVVAAKGFLFVPEGCGKDADTELKAPRAWIEEHAPKAKPAKDPKAAVQKNEGTGKASAKTRAKKGGKK